jgi:hypothetical protein
MIKESIYQEKQSTRKNNTTLNLTLHGIASKHIKQKLKE